MQSGGRWILGAWWSALAATAQHQELLAKFWGGLRMTITLKKARNRCQKKGKVKSHSDSNVACFVSGSSILELLQWELPPNHQNFLSEQPKAAAVSSCRHFAHTLCRKKASCWPARAN